MTDQNRINGQCPRCQSPLLYNADKDIFYCECGYTEKVKHNINIITNNNTIYQQSSKSSAENDDEYIYRKINKEIADLLCIGLTTVITHRKNIQEKLGIKSVSALTIYAVMHGFVDINHI